jgi:hypothetical protein
MLNTNKLIISFKPKKRFAIINKNKICQILDEYTDVFMQKNFRILIRYFSERKQTLVAGFLRLTLQESTKENRFNLINNERI